GAHPVRRGASHPPAAVARSGRVRRRDATVRGRPIQATRCPRHWKLVPSSILSRSKEPDPLFYRTIGGIRLSDTAKTFGTTSHRGLRLIGPGPCKAPIPLFSTGRGGSTPNVPPGR